MNKHRKNYSSKNSELVQGYVTSTNFIYQLFVFTAIRLYLVLNIFKTGFL